MTFVRRPDFVIGGSEPYLKRWWVIPRNRRFNVYLHEILRDDDDRALHDHPWWNVSVILRGGYVEVMPDGRRTRRVGQVVFRRAEAAHRLVLTRDVSGRAVPCWSLFITGPRVRDWGFWCPKGWRPWREFVNTRDHGSVGRGCD
ncbi:MAG TPA: hypothetical protein VNJ04_08195 [Gemmatimonadaceae bacterium]|nr:hypothetical protein [Gemmatimonadaceae bacterium]